MKEQTIDWSVPRRQSPSAVFIVIAKALIDVMKFLWPLLILYILRSSGKSADTWEIMLLAVPAISILNALVELYFFRFSIKDQELIIKKGFLIRKTIVLPLDKIQAVHIDRTWLHNLFSSAQISFDSAGSEKMEIKINAITLSMANELKEFISVRTGAINDEIAPSPVEKLILSLEMKDLLRLSISANHLEAFFILLAFALSTLDNIEKIIGDTGSGFWQQIVVFAMGSSGKMILFLCVALLLISITISTVRILLVYLDFRVTQTESGYRIKSGLINVKEKLLPFRKIQFISWRANWIRARMKLYLLKFHAVGAEEMRDKQQVRVPITRKEFIPLLSAPYYSLLHTEQMNALRIQPQFVYRKVIFSGFLPACILILFTFFPFGWLSLLWLIVIPFAWLHNFLLQKRFRLWANEDVLQIRKSVYGEEELIFKWNNAQRVRVQQSYYQRRNNLATVRILTAGGAVVIPYVKLDEAKAIMNYALYKIEKENQPWM